ncbi:MAG: hypothetical protein AAF799_33415 [Myxococcota bacterium]
MSDHEHDDHAGAHEVDNMPSGKLFNLLFGLSALTLAACIGVVQLFHQQTASIEAQRAKKESFQLTEYKEEMEAIQAEWSVVTINDDDGLTEAQGGKGPHEARRYQMPLSEARKRVLDAPDKSLKAGRRYRGWTNPDADAPKPSVKPRGAAGRPTPQIRRPAGAGAPTKGLPPGVVVPPRGAPAQPKGAAPAPKPTPAQAPPKPAPKPTPAPAQPKPAAPAPTPN